MESRNHQNQPRPELIRVTRHEPCPICDKSDWCSVAADGSFVICMRVDEGAKKETTNGGWVHVLVEDQPRRRPSGPIFTANKDPSPRADAQTLNRVYRDFHRQLELSGTHYGHLKERGLTPEEIRKLDYKSLPQAIPERARAINPLIERYGRKLLTVPAFYLTPKGKIWLSGVDGLLIPCKDADGNTVGYQIRADEKTKGGKYRWLSASNRKRKRGGVSSGTPIHVTGTESDSTRVWITEGILKADVAALKLGEIVIGVAGVGSWNRDELKRTLEKLYATSVVVAFDADSKRNTHVDRAQHKLAQAVLSLGYPVYLATWDINKGKGLDDLLTAGHHPEITRYYPPVDLGQLQSVRGEKRIRETEKPQDVEPKEPLDIPQLRQQMRNRISNFAQYADGGVLLIRATQGLGKTYTTIDVLDQLWRDGILRPVYVTPRHELISQNLRPGWFHVRPRQPMNQELRLLEPHQGLLLAEEAVHASDLSHHDLLCHRSKQADTLGNRRWSVPKNLCAQCEIGKHYGIDQCGYFRQYHSPKPLATVHETLFVTQFTKDILGNQQLEIGQSARQVCILDEPDPSKFYEVVNITPDDLSRAIVDAWDDNLKKLLTLVRNVSENVAGRLTFSGAQSRSLPPLLASPLAGQETVLPKTAGTLKDGQTLKRKIIGHEVMDELVSFAGGADTLEKLLASAKASAPSKHEKVNVGIDALIGERRRSWEVIINGETRFIPKTLADPIGSESMRMVKGYALREGFPILGDFEESNTDDVPLNFTSDLLKVLNREFRLYSTGEAYNSALVFTVAAKMPIIRLNLRRIIDTYAPMILLDGQGNADLLSRLLGRPVETWSPPISPDLEITQIVDGAYGIGSLWNAKTDAPKTSLKRLLEKGIFPLAEKDPENTLITASKRVADYLRELQDEGKLSPLVAIGHYGNLEGSNEHEDRKKVIPLGGPGVSPDDLEEMAHALFQNDETPISMETEHRWEGYNYQDCKGHGYEVKVRRYIDERVELLARSFKEDEIIQAVHRIRPILSKGKQIYLFTHLPIAELPPTRLVTLNDLAATLDANPKPVNQDGKLSREFFNDFTKGFLAENGAVWFESLKAALSLTILTPAIKDSYSDNEKRQCLCGFPPDSTLRRWLKEIAVAEGWNRSQVTVEHRGPDRGGGATWIVVYHEGELDEFQVLADYTEPMGIDRYNDLVTVEPLPWTAAEIAELSVVIPLHHAKKESDYSPPQRE